MLALLLDSGPPVSFPPQQALMRWKQMSVTVCAWKGNVEPRCGQYC